MKKILVFLLWAAFCTIAGAAPITVDMARAKAEAFMQKKGWANVAGVSEASLPRRMASRNTAQQPFYVFNAEGGNGFVIVSGDDRCADILGYAEQGSLDEEIPENMKVWLEGYARQIEMIQNGEVEIVPAQQVRAPHAAIDPLLQTKWDQGTPYNNLCPKTNSGQSTYSGCVATALAQVMYYYKWPEQTTRNIPGYTTRVQRIVLEELPQTTFDWDAMQLTYRGNETEETAVATLMRYVGQALRMDYSPTGSGAASENIPKVLTNFFNYDPNAYLAYRKDYTIAEWDELIYHELEENRPVLYAGSSMSTGHQFVCDGYDGDGFYHINWGWSGSKDNYFRLSILNPLSTAGAGSGTTPDGYNNEQSAVIGVQLPTGDPVVERESLPNLTFMSENEGMLTANFEGWNQYGNYDCGIAIQNADGSLQVLAQNTVWFDWGQGGQVEYDLNSLTPNSEGYILVGACKQTWSEEWTRVGTTLHYTEVTYNQSSSETQMEVVVHPIENLVLNDFRLVSQVKTGSLCKMEVDIENLGDEYNGYLFVYAYGGDPNENIYPTGFTTIALPEGATETFTLYYEVPTTDDLHIWLLTKSYTELYLMTFPEYQLEILDVTISQNPLIVTVTVQNNSDMDYNSAFRATLYQKKKKKGSLDKTQLIPAHGTTQFVYDTFQLNGQTYDMKFSYLKTEIATSFVDMGVSIPLQEIATGIYDVRSQEDGILSPSLNYDLQGRCVNGEGVKMKKGVYIHQGKKVIIK